MSGNDTVAVLALVNPIAGRGRAVRAYRAVHDVLARRFPRLRTAHTTRPGEATEISAQAVRQGINRIICFGGDGTLHEVTNAIATADVSIAVIPSGSGNDLARTLSIPTDPLAAALLAADCLGPTPIDLGTVNGSYFANVAGAGFDAEVAREKDRRFRFVPGTGGFVAAALLTLATYRNVEIKIEHDRGQVTGMARLIAVANGKYYGGGMKVAPHADPSDGLFDVVVAWDLGRLETLATIPLVYSGAHMRKPKVTSFRSRRITVDSAVPLSIQADGEIVGRLPTTFTLIPGALKVCMPAK